MDRKHFANNLWRWKVGVPEVEPTPLDHVSQWSPRFEQLMRNRLVFGAYRYGRINADCKPRYDRVGSCIARLQMYRESGNLEHLVDVANLCLLEFEEGRHPTRHFLSVDDGKHVEKES